MRKAKIPKNNYDLIVVGGGPAGMMAAGRAAERGLRVLLVEKNEDVGKKLLITGGGRCNLTNGEFNTRVLLEHFKGSSKFLFSPFSQHGVEDTLTFFHSRGMETKIENNKRVFPISNSAHSVWMVLKDYMKENNVVVEKMAEVAGFEKSDEHILGIRLTNNTLYTSHSYVLATGGKSRPETGSTGDGFRWLTTLGHSVQEPNASLVPLTVNEPWISRLAGLTLEKVKISVYQYEKKQLTAIGKILFTHVGISGPTILNMSKAVRELLDYGPVTLFLDLFPHLNEASLDEELLRLFQSQNNRQFKNALSSFLPSALAPVVVELSGIMPTLMCNSITKENRKKLVKLLKSLSFSVKGLLGVDKAIVTSGGVDLKEVDLRTMRSRLYPNLYLVGDVLNIDRPSGGYSLQLCWTTGFVAGNSVPPINSPQEPL